MVLKSLLIFLVIAVLLEDSASIRKTEEEKKEEEELAKRVNATLAEEEEKERQEEEEKRKKKQGKDLEKKQDETPKKEPEKEEKGAGQAEETGGTGKEKSQGEACPTLNQTCLKQESCQPCPEVRLCLPCKVCPAPVDCPKADSCQPCAPSPPIDCGPCPEVGPCRPCLPCVPNNTIVQPPHSGCPEPVQTMTVPVAMAVGAGAALLVTGVATVVGLVIRYVPRTSNCLWLRLCVHNYHCVVLIQPVSGNSQGTRKASLDHLTGGHCGSWPSHPGSYPPSGRSGWSSYSKFNFFLLVEFHILKGLH
jgi:hypothetical protein